MSTSSSISRSSKHAKKVANDIITKWRIFKGDRVQVNTGKDRGQIGTVSKVFRKENRMIVQGCNLVKKHVKKTAKAEGGVFSIEAPIHYSNVNLVDPNTNQRCRVETKFLDDGTKVRGTKGKFASFSFVPKPDLMFERKTPRVLLVGKKDTTEELVNEVTYFKPQPPAAAAAAKKKN